MYSVFLILHKIKQIIPSKSQIYFECTLNNEKLSTEPMIATSEMTVDTELVFYLTEEQYTFLKSNRLNCKLSCYQKPKKLIGFVLLDMRKSESVIPPTKKKWYTLMNTSYTPKPQLLIGFGIGGIEQQSTSNLNMMSPESLIHQALQIWTPSLPLNLHQGNIVIGNGNVITRMTVTASISPLNSSSLENKSIAFKLLNKQFVLNSTKSNIVHQFVFEGNYQDLMNFWTSTFMTLFLVHHENLKPIKKGERLVALIDLFNSTLSASEMDPFLISFSIIGFPTIPSPIAQKEASIIDGNLETSLLVDPEEPELDSSESSHSPSIIQKPLTSELHQYRLSVDLRQFTSHKAFHSDLILKFDFYPLNHHHHFSSLPFTPLINNAISIKSGFSAYEFSASPLQLSSVLHPLQLQLFSHDSSEKNSLITTFELLLYKVTSSQIQPDKQNESQLQLVDQILTNKSGTLKTSIALEDFGLVQSLEEPKSIQEPQVESVPHEESVESVRSVQSVDIKIERPKTPKTPKFASKIPIALKPDLSLTFKSYKQVEQLLQECTAIQHSLINQTAIVANKSKIIEQQQHSLNNKVQQHKDTISQLSKSHSDEINELKQQLMDLTNDSQNKQLATTQKLKEVQLDNKQLEQQLKVKDTFIHKLQLEMQQLPQIVNQRKEQQLQQELIQIEHKLKQSEQAKLIYKDKCKLLSSQITLMQENRLKEQQDKINVDGEIVEKMKWRWMITEENKKNERDQQMLKGLQQDLRKMKGKGLNGEVDRLMHEKQELLRTGLYYHTDPLIMQLDEKIQQYC